MATYDIVSNRRKVQGVDLQPYGNTISVEAESDNPFEDAQDVEVFTQVNRGMGDVGPHRGARSRAIVTRPQKERMVFAGRAKAMKVVAPAHKVHAAFIPGLSGFGEAPGGTITMGPATPAAPGTDWAAVGTATNALASTAAQIYAQQQAAKTAQAQAAAAQANAQAEAARTERMSAMTMLNNMGKQPAISGTLLAVGGAAALVALFLFLRKGGKRK